MSDWHSISPNRGKLVLKGNTWIIVIPLLLIVLLMAYLGLSKEIPVIVSWALAATLAWHGFCVRHYLLVDKGKGTLTHHLSSLYPIAHAELPLAQMAGFCVTKTPFKRRAFSLVVIMDDGQRVCLLRNKRLSCVEGYARRLADFCQLPFRTELSQ